MAGEAMITTTSTVPTTDGIYLRRPKLGGRIEIANIRFSKDQRVISIDTGPGTVTQEKGWWYLPNDYVSKMLAEYDWVGPLQIKGWTEDTPEDWE